MKPDLTFYYDVSVDIAIKRIMIGRLKLKYYEAGMDLNLSNDIYESYRIFQSRIISEYRSMAKRESFRVMDGTLGIEEQQREMRRQVIPLLPPYVTEMAVKELSAR